MPIRLSSFDLSQFLKPSRPIGSLALMFEKTLKGLRPVRFEARTESGTTTGAEIQLQGLGLVQK